MKKRIFGIDFNQSRNCERIGQYIHDPIMVAFLEQFCNEFTSLKIGNKIYFWRPPEEQEGSQSGNNSQQTNFWDRWEKYIFEKIEVSDELNNYMTSEWGGIPGSSDNPVNVGTYNTYARFDEWPGGYVQGYGYVSVESSNSTVYGQPMIMGTSWVYKGISEVPVTMGRFYNLVLNSLWNGGYVDNYGYVGEYQQVLGTSGIDPLVQVYPGYGTIGAVVNASLMMDQAVTQSQVYNYMGGTTISDDGLLLMLQHFFPTSTSNIYDDIVDALNDQCVIIARVNMNSYITNVPNHVGDGDYNVLDYNPVKRRYVCFDCVSKQIKVIDKDLVDIGTINVRFYIISR